MSKVKVGIIGCGYMAQYAHIPCLAMIEDAEITAICDPRKKITDTLSKKYNIPNVTDSDEELVKMDIDAVVVLTTVAWHKHHIVMALEAGKHVLTE